MDTLVASGEYAKAFDIGSNLLASMDYGTDDTRALVGMVAVPIHPAAVFAAPPWRLLEAIAHTLYDAGDVALSVYSVGGLD